MNELSDTDTKGSFWKSIQNNLLFVGLIELLIYNGGLIIKYLVQRKVDFFTPIVGSEFALYYNANFWIIIPILLSLLFMRWACPEALAVFTEGSLKTKLKALGKGLLLGFTCLGLLTLLAALSGAVTFTFNRFTWQLIPVILPLFIQCTAEEILLRGYVPAVLKGTHRWDVICFTSGMLFIFHHIFNMEHYGFSTMFCLNVFLLGVAFCLLVWNEGNFWIAAGIHTAWNYVQEFLFGISSSGMSFTIGLFKGTLNGDSIFYQEVYGYEGALVTTVLMAVMIGFLLHRLHKRGLLQGEVAHES